MTDFSTKLPLWYQLAAMLRADIMGGRLAPGARIEPEVRLAKRHGISVIPVRQALRALREEGLIVRQRGSGTFVKSDVRVTEGATPLEALYSREFTKPAQILERGIVATPARFAEYFSNTPEMAFFRRLAYRDDRPWSYGTLYFLPEFNVKITTKLLQRWPLYRIVSEQCGVDAARSHFDAQAISASTDVAALFGIEPFSPMLALASVSYDADERPIAAFEMVFPGSPFVFSFETVHKLG